MWIKVDKWNNLSYSSFNLLDGGWVGPSACVEVLENREITAPAGNQTQHNSANSLVSSRLLLPRLKQPIFI